MEVCLVQDIAAAPLSRLRIQTHSWGVTVWEGLDNMSLRRADTSIDPFRSYVSLIDMVGILHLHILIYSEESPSFLWTTFRFSSFLWSILPNTHSQYYPWQLLSYSVVISLSILCFLPGAYISSLRWSRLFSHGCFPRPVSGPAYSPSCSRYAPKEAQVTIL